MQCSHVAAASACIPDTYTKRFRFRFCLPRHHCDPVNDILQQIDDLSVEVEGATKWTGADDVERETAGDEAPPRHVKGVLIDPGFDASDYKYLISLNCLRF